VQRAIVIDSTPRSAAWKRGVPQSSLRILDRAPIPGSSMPRFEGSSTYVATDDLKLAVNAALTLQRPLLIKANRHGQDHAGRGSRRALDMPLLAWHIKSTTKAQQGLYEYDAVSRLRDSQLAMRGSRTSRTTSSRRAVAGVHVGRAVGAADRRDRQGGHRVPE